MQGLHPIAREAWESIHQIYGAQCYETPLMRAEWLRERADAAQVCLGCGAEECIPAPNQQLGDECGTYHARLASHTHRPPPPPLRAGAPQGRVQAGVWQLPSARGSPQAAGPQR